ncbi:hypothetical protein PLEOSDRAFT_1107443 [Pleurotus ostreatus PC15]|uniref:Uncharacterized protein n=1 Tax=Pleurotus ostreatus (strain PC15) TaxID=1137138 RepID=A0A067NLN3_PLEO1|nr:hypothetical protein PLEOSDRAFT_1107443 [Pleurotus ostreatus PC15]
MSATTNGTKESICRSIFEKYGVAPGFYTDLMKDIEDNLYDLIAPTTYDAASEIARNNNKWDSWCASVHAMTKRVHTFVHVIPSVTTELEAVASAVRYPSKLRNLSDLRQKVPSLGKYNKFLDDIAEWAKSPERSRWDEALNPDVLQLYTPWCITLDAIQAGSCDLAARTAPDALLHTIFSGGSSDESRHTMYTEVDVLLPVMLDSPHPLKTARADTCFGMVAPKDLLEKIDAASFTMHAALYTSSLRCMDIQREDLAFGTFFAEWKRNSTPSDASRQAVYYGYAMQALRQLFKLPARPLYGMVFEKGVLHLAAMTIDSTDNSYVQLQQSMSIAHSWDLRHPSALVECFYFILALKKTVDANLQKDFEELRQRDDAALIDWDALRKRADDWRKYDAGRSKTAKIKRLKGARPGLARGDDGGSSPADERSGGNNNESTNVDHKSDDYQMDSEESSSDDEESDPEERHTKYVSILSWRRGKEYPVQDLDAWYRDPESLKLVSRF